MKDIIREHVEHGPTGCTLENLVVTYLNAEHFKVFMNLIIAPERIKVEIPENMTEKDLEDILSIYTYSGGCDDYAIRNIKTRFESNKRQ